MQDIELKQIASRLSGRSETFEELCSQIARRTVENGSRFERLNGAGGDGGIECFVDLPDGSRVGWQAKYIFEYDSLIKQLTRSLETALAIHRTLCRYVVCFPFDLSGPTGRKGKSQLDKFDNWWKKQTALAATTGRKLEIEAWPASQIRDKLTGVDHNGGMREYFFNEKVLSQRWFTDHIGLVTKVAGPRYTSALTVETDLSRWFEAFGRQESWRIGFRKRLNKYRQATAQLLERIAHPPAVSDSSDEVWADGVNAIASRWSEIHSLSLNQFSRLLDLDPGAKGQAATNVLRESLDLLRSIESGLSAEMDTRFGVGKWDSPNFRQFMAEYQCSLAAANVDRTRDAIASTEDFLRWFEGPDGCLPFEDAFVLSGAAGVGKTHGICDVAASRLAENRLTCIVFGHQFGGEPEIWTRLRDNLGLPTDLNRDGLLDALEAAAEASCHPLMICLDAINETKPLCYWRDRVTELKEAIRQRSFLRLCITCRTSFLSHCLPEPHDFFVAEHRGFKGMERDACQAFFEHYGLVGPIGPMLQPELANPLFLKLACSTARSLGLTALPSGWLALGAVIKTFLDFKEKAFATDNSVSVGASLIAGSLLAIARELASKGTSALSWTQAATSIRKEKPLAANYPVLEWLIGAELLIEDAPLTSPTIGSENSLRISFERLSDFLIAKELLSEAKADEFETAFASNVQLQNIFSSAESVSFNNGVVSALSILIPEQFRPGSELTDFLPTYTVRAEAMRIVIDALPSRDPSSFSLTTANLIEDAFSASEYAFTAMDAVISIAWHDSFIDARWLDRLLKEHPLANRDSLWCAYLHESFDDNGPVKRLIDAVFELPLKDVEKAITERWLLLLYWFTAAADRRVKDFATRAAGLLLASRTELVPLVLAQFIDIDDDAVRERVLLSIYGVLMLTRNAETLAETSKWLIDRARNNPSNFDHALIRDHSKCICELAIHVLAPASAADYKLPIRLESEWPIELPSDDEVKRWKSLPKLEESCTNDDFYTYTLSCLYPYEHTVRRDHMAKWILARIARDFQYAGSGCEEYDRQMLELFGYGRSREVWAERIGKKYQWTAMFQLAARLFDHVEPELSDWEREPNVDELVLLSERQLHPTLPGRVVPENNAAKAWWIPGSVDFAASASLGDDEWIALPGDIPDLATLLTTFSAKGSQYRLLEAYPRWDNRLPDAKDGTPYRYVWIHLRGFLVPKRTAKKAFETLIGRNFFGNWMPNRRSWLHGFFGEYPWGIPYIDMQPYRDKPYAYRPITEQISSEWEWDASRPRNVCANVPSREFFSAGDLRWNGVDGFETANHRIVFRDPSLSDVGPGALIADIDELSSRLKSLNRGVIVTLLGEKHIIGNRDSNRATFSQVARLHDSGRVEFGPIRYFTDFDEDAGFPQTMRR